MDCASGGRKDAPAAVAMHMAVVIDGRAGGEHVCTSHWQAGIARYRCSCVGCRRTQATRRWAMEYTFCIATIQQHRNNPTTLKHMEHKNIREGFSVVSCFRLYPTIVSHPVPRALLPRISGAMAAAAAAAAAARLSKLACGLAPARLLGGKPLSTKVDLAKATSIAEEISKTLQDSTEELAVAKVRGLVDNLTQALNCPAVESRLTKVEIHRDLDQRIAISLYTLFGAVVVGFHSSINSLQVDVDFQKDAAKTTNANFEARISSLEAKVDVNFQKDVAKTTNTNFEARISSLEAKTSQSLASPPTKEHETAIPLEFSKATLPPTKMQAVSLVSESTAKGSWFGWFWAPKESK